VIKLWLYFFLLKKTPDNMNLPIKKRNKKQRKSLSFVVVSHKESFSVSIST